MRALKDFCRSIDVLFTDIDGTLTTHQGFLPAQSYTMLWELHECGIQVVPVTGRPAGWCEMIARLWPVEAVIGENGAFYFRHKNKKMERFFIYDESTRLRNQKKLKILETLILNKVPGSAISSDQFTRLFDLAIDFCEDVKPLEKKQINQILGIFEQWGAKAKLSSIHINGWFGDYDKKTMCELFYENCFQKKLKDHQQNCAFVGDSPNDEPLFAFFKNSFAVANIVDFKQTLCHPPSFITPSRGAGGFVELGTHLLDCRNKKESG